MEIQRNQTKEKSSPRVTPSCLIYVKHYQDEPFDDESKQRVNSHGKTFQIQIGIHWIRNDKNQVNLQEPEEVQA